ncbi:hypothetical protein DL96DRAFT_1621103 [Flagelloscypha sp. PMI_526]|nr:hypothetical protein DL96DRAFT_1621103 [Flagelloscypha sp. PMI_526]
MTRGRRRDLTLPPSRTLTQQRDYRARKAQTIRDLETRCQRAEAENVQLREQVTQLQAELEFSRSGQTSSSLQTVEQVLQDLERATQSARRLQTSLTNSSSNTNHSDPPITSPRELSSPSTSSSQSQHPPPTPGVQPGGLGDENTCCYGYIHCDGLVDSDGEEYCQPRSPEAAPTLFVESALRTQFMPDRLR